MSNSLSNQVAVIAANLELAAMIHSFTDNQVG